MRVNLKKNKAKTGCRFDRNSAEPSIKKSPVKQALVADDNHALCKFLIMALEIIGFEVRTAKDGREAYELFLKNNYDLVITDFQMPVMDGFALIRKIKTKCPNVPIILISGAPLDDLSTIGGPSALEGILSKPFSLTELHRTALQAMSRRK